MKRSGFADLPLHGGRGPASIEDLQRLLDDAAAQQPEPGVHREDVEAVMRCPASRHDVEDVLLGTPDAVAETLVDVPGERVPLQGLDGGPLRPRARSCQITGNRAASRRRHLCRSHSAMAGAVARERRVPILPGRVSLVVRREGPGATLSPVVHSIPEDDWVSAEAEALLDATPGLREDLRAAMDELHAGTLQTVDAAAARARIEARTRTRGSS